MWSDSGLASTTAFVNNMANETKKEDSQFDTMTDASTTTFRMDTPSTTTRASGSWDDQRVIPCPEQTFRIIEKHSGRAIAIVGDKAKLRDLRDTNHLDTHWYCVKQDGYFGFQHPSTGSFLGHDGKGGVHAFASHLKPWEFWTPREHKNGGYELLSPSDGTKLMLLCVKSDGNSLVRRHYGITLWEFVRV